MNKKIKFGIVGLGHIGTRHAKCIFDNTNAVLSSAYDILPKKTGEAKIKKLYIVLLLRN